MSRRTPTGTAPKTGPTRARKRPQQRPPPSARSKARQTLSEKPEFYRAAKLMSAEHLSDSGIPEFPEIHEQAKRDFLQAYVRTGQIGASCRAAGISTSRSLYWREQDLEFATAFLRAQRLAVELWEAELARRGFEGVETPVFHKGKLVATVKEFDTTAGIFMLKGARPDKYRDNVNISGGSPAAIIHVNTLSDDELEKRFERLKEILRPGLPAATNDVIDTQPVGSPEERAYEAALDARKKELTTNMRDRK